MIIYEAGFIGVLRTIAIIGLFYYGFKFLVRVAFPWLLKRWMNKKMGQFQNQGSTQFQEQQKAQEFAKQHEGEVKIKSRGNHSKSEPSSMGDFVDFEEIE